MKNSSGFTLVEVLVTGFLAVAVGAALVGLQYILTQNQLSVFSNFINVDEANFAITNLERELRSARSGDNGAYPLEIAGNFEIAFFYYTNDSWPVNAEGNPLTQPSRLSNTRLVGILIRLNSDSSSPDKDYILE